MEQNQSVKPNQQTVPLKNETWRLALQTFLNLVIATVIAVILVLTLSALMTSLWGKLVVEAVCLVITLPIVYGYLWGQGDRDANFVQFGRMAADPWKGLRASVIGVIPTVLTCVPLALSKVKVIPFDFMPIYRILNAPMWGFINLIHAGGAIAHAATEAIPATDTMPAIDAMPATEALSWGGFVILALLPLIYVIIGTVGYYMGTRRISVMSKLVYKDDKKKHGRKHP